MGAKKALLISLAKSLLSELEGSSPGLKAFTTSSEVPAITFIPLSFLTSFHYADGLHCFRW